MQFRNSKNFSQGAKNSDLGIHNTGIGFLDFMNGNQIACHFKRIHHEVRLLKSL